MNKIRDGKIEFLRFIAALIIMCGHMGYFECNIERPFAGGWVYVEFFLILSGFFTVQHFDKVQGENRVKLALDYTLNKFKRFMPFTIPAVLCAWVLNNGKVILEGSKEAILQSFEDMPFEMLFLSAANTNGSRLFTIWFLSAMFIVFPLVCILAQLKNRELRLLIALYSSVFYYLFRYDFGSHEYPNQMIRAFAGMMLGFVVYDFSKRLREADSLKNSNLQRALFTCLELATYILPLLILYKNYIVLRLDLLCFILCTMVIFSEKSMIPPVRSKVLAYLGKLSMPMYIWHLVVASVIRIFLQASTNGEKIAVFYVGTIMVSILNTELVRILNK